MQWHTLQQDWGKTDKERKRGGKKRGRGRRVVLDVHPKTKEKRKGGEEGGKEERGSKMEKQGASHHLCPQVLQPCHHAMLLREECIHVHANAWQRHVWHLMPSSP